MPEPETEPSVPEEESDPRGKTGILAAGEFHTVGLRADGSVVATGSDGYGQCGMGS